MNRPELSLPHQKLETSVPAWLFGSAGSARARRMLLLLLFPALTLAGTLRFDFVFDDNIVVLGDPLVTETLELRAVFGSEVRVANLALGYYRPIITLLYRADRALWGLNPAGYHFTNLLWHLLATFLVYQVALCTTGRMVAAWASAMLFAVLPAHTEAIAWIQGRVDLVSTAFVLLTLLALVRARDEVSNKAWWWSAVAGLMFLGALLAKESAAAFPLAWAMWELPRIRRGHGGKRLASLAFGFLPLVLGGLAYWILRRWAVGKLVPFPMSLSPAALRALALPSVLSEYGRALLFPDLTLNFFRGLWVVPSPTTMAIALTVPLLLVGGLVATWRGAPLLFPWAAWVPIMLFPPLSFVLYARVPEVGFYTAERFLYLPSVGWCVLLGSLVARAMNACERVGRPWWGLTTFGGLLLGYAGLTLIRLLPWADPSDFYIAMKAQTRVPTEVRVFVHHNLGTLYLDRGQFAAARQEFQETLHLKPDNSFSHNNLGVLLIREGKPVEARRWLETAIRLDPTYADAYGNLGAAYEATGDLLAARRAYEAGLRMAPRSAWLARGLTRVNAKDAASRHPQVGESR